MAGSYRVYTEFVRASSLAALLVLAATVPSRALGQGAPYDHPRDEKLVIDSVRLGQCLAGVTREEFADSYSFARDEMPFEYEFDDFLAYLSADPRRADYGNLGSVVMLREWVLEQPGNSIDPVAIFRASMRLNRGNVWNAMLAIHELLRNEARWWDTRNYWYRSTPEREREFFGKFVDIRGDLVDRGAGFRGDHAGTWYRIWGIMLFRMSLAGERSLEREVVDGMSCDYIRGSDTVGSLLQDLSGAFVARSSEWIKLAPGFWNETDGRKAEINARGNSAAAAMLRAMSAPGPVRRTKGCDRADYLRVAPPPRPSAGYWTQP